jgi:ABC-2 type transport system ATP-binding protein
VAGTTGAGVAVVETDGLGRVFTAGRRSARRGRARPIVALDDVRLRIAPGEVHGVLGPNGSGKTTLVKILSTLLLPTGGRASVLGHDVVREAKAVRPHVGIVLGGERGLYNRLSARRNLLYWAALYRVAEPVARARTEMLLDRLGLAGRADERVENYSRGMKQRLHLARSLVADPPLLFLDEPSLGLDPVAAREMRGLVGELRDEGRTILLTTHDMAEAEQLCDRVTLIEHGRILATETPGTLATWLSRFERIEARGVPVALLDELQAIPGVTGATAVPETGSTRIEVDEEAATATVLSRLVAAGVTSICTSRPSLEEVYMQVFGHRGLQVGE